MAPEPVAKSVAEYIAEVNFGYPNSTSRRSQLQTDLARVDRQIKTMVQTIADTGGSRRLVDELRTLEQRQDGLKAEIAAAGTPEPLPALHPNLAQVYRQKVERLEQALHDPSVSAAAVEALRSLIDAIVVHPGEQRGEVSVELRGDLAAFLRLAGGDLAASILPPADAKTAASRAGNGGSIGMMGSLVAGTGFEPAAFRL